MIAAAAIDVLRRHPGAHARGRSALRIVDDAVDLGHAGGSAHFARSIDAVRQAFTREGVRWRGQALAELPR